MSWPRFENPKQTQKLGWAQSQTCSGPIFLAQQLTNMWLGPDCGFQTSSVNRTGPRFTTWNTLNYWTGPRFSKDEPALEIGLGPDSEPENPWITGLGPDSQQQIRSLNWTGPRSWLRKCLKYWAGPRFPVPNQVCRLVWAQIICQIMHWLWVWAQILGFEWNI